MFSPKLLRMFSYKPLADLHFDQGRSLIMKTTSSSGLFTLSNYTSLTIPSLMLFRLLTKCTLMGNFNFFFSSFLFLGTSLLSKSWLGFTERWVKELYLLKSGKYIEITSHGIRGRKYKIKISDILNPEEHLQTKIKMQHYGTWVIDTKQGLTFYLVQDSEAYYKDVLKHVLQGVDIEVKDQADRSDIIDI